MGLNFGYAIVPDKANAAVNLFTMAAPSQHPKAFHEAFGIRPRDRMWLNPDDRVVIW